MANIISLILKDSTPDLKEPIFYDKTEGLIFRMKLWLEVVDRIVKYFGFGWILPPLVDHYRKICNIIVFRKETMTNKVFWYLWTVYCNIFMNRVKVIQFWNAFLMSSIPPKNERKQVNQRFHSSKVEFLRSFFGGYIVLRDSFLLFWTLVVL